MSRSRGIPDLAPWTASFFWLHSEGGGAGSGSWNAPLGGGPGWTGGCGKEPLGGGGSGPGRVKLPDGGGTGAGGALAR